MKEYYLTFTRTKTISDGEYWIDAESEDEAVKKFLEEAPCEDGEVIMINHVEALETD